MWPESEVFLSRKKGYIGKQAKKCIISICRRQQMAKMLVGSLLCVCVNTQFKIASRGVVFTFANRSLYKKILHP